MPDRYDDLVNRALEQYERLERVCGDEEIVFVISRDVRRVIGARYDAYLPTEAENHEIFYGAAIYTIAEAAENMLAAVVCGRNYYNGMQVGDLILYENHLWRLNGNASFIDTGLTVPYEGLEDTEEFPFAEGGVQAADYAAAIDRVAEVFADAGTALATANINAATTTATNINDAAIANAENAFWDYAAPRYLNNTFTNANYMNFWPTFTEAIQDNRASRRKRKAKEKEEELSAGDTELLDEFLDSFAKR